MTLHFGHDLRRILFVSPVGVLGGAERALLDVLASLHQSEPLLQLHLLTFGSGPLGEEALRLGVTVEILSLPPELHTLGDSGMLQDNTWRRGLELLSSLTKASPTLATYITKFRARIEDIAPDLVHTNGIKAHFLSALAKRGPRPLVWHVHDFLSERPVARLAAKWLGRQADAAVAISAAVAKDLANVLPELPVTIVRNAVDIQEFSEGPPNVTGLDILAGLSPAPADTLRVGLVATYARWKGHETFLQAAARVRQALPRHPIRFYVVGGPIYATDASQYAEEELRMRIRALGLAETTSLVPFQRDLPWVYRSLDVVVHASTRAEPFGRTIVEAMACGRAVIVSATGGAQELVDKGRTGLTHTPGNVAELADCIKVLVESPEFRRRLGNNARTAAVLAFSRERLGPALLALYRNLEIRAAPAAIQPPGE